MQRAPLLMLILASAALAGCSTTAKRSPRQQVSTHPIQVYHSSLTPGRNYVYNGVDQSDIDDRAKELQSHGMSHDRAVNKATREANRDVWTSDSAAEETYERARLDYQAEQDKLNTGLRKLLADRRAQ